MEITIALLDKRICDVEEGASNTQTYREYLQQGEGEFGLEPVKLDNLSANQLNEYLDFIDYLWTK